MALHAAPRPLAWKCGAAASLWLLGLCAGCGPGNVYVPPPPPEVVVGVPEQRSVTIYREYPGNTQASESVEVRARVGGYLESLHFRDGATVSTGERLFVIDPRPYEAQLAAAKADLASKKASAAVAEIVYKRYTVALVPYNAATQEDVDTQKANLEVAQAGVSQADASVSPGAAQRGLYEDRRPHPRPHRQANA